jgi:hypothetical protein
MITNSIRNTCESDMVENLFMKQLVQIEDQVKCHRYYLNQLKRFVDLFEQAGVRFNRLQTKRRVRKDNSIVYKGRAYSVPFGTYLSNIRIVVRVMEQYGLLMIVCLFNDELLALHLVGQGKPACRLRDDPQLPPF